MGTDTEDAGEEHHGDDLLELLGQVAKELAEPEGFQETLQRAVDLTPKVLTRCDGASLMVVHRRRIDTPASSSRMAYDADQAQFATDQGPCLDAIAEHHTMVLNDLEAEERWPDYRQKALRLGVCSQLSVRLFVVGDTLGALSLYSPEPHAFDGRSITIAQVLAMHVSVAMKAAFTEAGLRTALRTRDVIGQAKGIVMANHKLTEDLAFHFLRHRSQHSNVPLRDVAREIAEAGALTDPVGAGG